MEIYLIKFEIYVLELDRIESRYQIFLEINKTF